MANKWMTHVKKTMKKMSSKKKSMGKGWFKSVLKEAKHTYHKGGGMETVTPSTSEETKEAEEVKEPVEGGKRRHHGKKTHRRRRHH